MIDGLIIYEQWVSPSEEQELIALLPKSEQRPTSNRNHVIRWGKSPYNSDILIQEIPEPLKRLGKQLVEQGLLTEEPNSISANEYFPGQKIDLHVDNQYSGEIISVLSLESDAIMMFKNPPNIVAKTIPAQSLLQIKGPARWEWSHGVEPVKDHRWSIVFRNSTK